MPKNQIHLTWRAKFRKAMLSLADRIDIFFGVASKYEAPRWLSHQYGITSDIDVAMHFFRILLDHTNITRISSILEIGCGAGRNTGPLKYYLKEPGFYEGFDIMPDGIEHCISNVSPHFNNFHFQRVDIFNSYYNPSGKIKSKSFKFPFPDSTFDVVLSTSVLTHMRPADARHYVAESARVLKPGGTVMHTFFVLDDDGIKAVQAETGTPFRFWVEDFMTGNTSYVEEAVAMPEALVRSMYEDAGLDIQILPAQWSNGEQPVSFQNVVLGLKRA